MQAIYGHQNERPPASYTFTFQQLYTTIFFIYSYLAHKGQVKT